MMKLADHAGRALARLADANERIMVLDGDLADSDGAHHFSARHPERFLMSGIAEQNMVSVAAGMAETGLLPCVFSFAAFLAFRAYDQIRVCLSQANQPVILLGSHAGGLAGRNGKTHAALNDLALFLTLPGLRVWAPADARDVEFAINESMRSPCATYIRLPRKQFADDDQLPGDAAKLRWLRPRKPITLVSTGLASRWALEVAARLQLAGIDVGVLHCLQLSLHNQLATELTGIGQLVTIEDHYTSGGLGALISELYPHTPVRRFGWPTSFGGKSGLDDQLLNEYRLTSDEIASDIARDFH